jgi:hypothetical protein
MATSNMSRKSRRKTLSHAEIENFLCDLGNDDETEVIKKSPSDNVMVVNVCEGSLLNDSENQTENPSSSCVAQQEEEDRQYRANVVRAFHKDLVSMKPTDSNTASMNAYAKIIHQDSDYPILPTRQIFPENYKHSITSLESKKALLMSMQPTYRRRRSSGRLTRSFWRISRDVKWARTELGRPPMSIWILTQIYAYRAKSIHEGICSTLQRRRQRQRDQLREKERKK